MYHVVMRVCSSCKKRRRELEFNYKYKSEGIRQKTCRMCTRKQIKNHYDNNRQYYLDKSRSRNGIVRKKLRDYIWRYLLQNPCVDCGETDPVVLEFDHQADKVISISQAIQYNYTLEKIQNEIAKCLVRCANCHRRKTARQMGWSKLNMPL